MLFELGARPHPPRALYRAYLEQSDVFVGIYAQSYGWVAPGMEVSGLEDEYDLAGSMPKLVYVKEARERDPGLTSLLARVASDDVSYRHFETADELAGLLADDLALLVSERFAQRPGRAGALRSSLPAPASSFVGREREVDEVAELLLRADVRLLTLAGPGGIGKTRLALEASRRVADGFADGVAFVPLASVADAEDVVPAVCQALDVREDASTPLLDALCARVAELEALLVLDNMEHVVAAAPLAGRLLAAAPGLTVLATSRVRLDVTGEHLFHVPPLGLPDLGEREAAEIERSDAVKLFSARARASGWATTDADAPIVAEIVRRLDGLPLAIELAAAQARLVPAELIHTRLRRRLDLAGAPRDAEERHRTLRSTIAWSYDLLDEPARRFFETLSVFTGGFSIDAAAAVADTGEDVEGLLASLVDASLVTTGPSRVTGVRFDMLETIREFAGELLEEHAGRDEAVRRHLAYFADLGDEIFDAPHAARGLALLRMDEERGNFRAALEEALQVAPVDAVRIAGALDHLWSYRGFAHEGREVVARALAAAPDAPAQWRARALLAGAWLAAEQRDIQEASRQASEALRLFEEIGDARRAGDALHALGWSAWRHGEGELAASYIERSYRVLSELGDDSLALLAEGRLADLLIVRGELGEARRAYERVLAQEESAGLDEDRAGTLAALGRLEERLGDTSAAKASYEASVAISRRVENKLHLADALIALAGIDLRSGSVEDAGRAYAEGLDVCYELGDRLGIARCLEGGAGIALRRGDPEAATRLLGAAGAIRESLGVVAPEIGEQEAEARRALGDARFERVTQEGATLGHREVSSLFSEALGHSGADQAS